MWGLRYRSGYVTLVLNGVKKRLKYLNIRINSRFSTPVAN